MTDKIEAVKKVTETLSKQSQGLEEAEHLSANKGQFDSFMNTAQSIKSPSFERVDTKAFAIEETQQTEKNPILSDENLSSQKNGSATDQEGKRRQKDETGEIEGVASTGSKTSTERSSGSSLMDEVSQLNKGPSNISNASPDSIKAQTKSAITQIDGIKTQLAQSQGEIKPSYQTLLRNRLTHIDDNLKIALNKAGVEHKAPPVGATENKNPISRFIGFLSNSQEQLGSLNAAVDAMSKSGTITPANMLAIQMKMNQVQQQIELFTNLLNKALESTKTIMNVQV